MTLRTIRCQDIWEGNNCLHVAPSQNTQNITYRLRFLEDLHFLILSGVARWFKVDSQMTGSKLAIKYHQCMSSHFCLGSYCKEEFQQHDPLKHLDLLRFNTYSPMVKVLSPLTFVFSKLQSTPLGVKVCRYMVLRPKDQGKQSDSRSEGHLGREMTLRSGRGTTHPWGQWFTLGLRQGQSCLGLKEECGM